MVWGEMERERRYADCNGVDTKGNVGDSEDAWDRAGDSGRESRGRDGCRAEWRRARSAEACVVT